MSGYVQLCFKHLNLGGSLPVGSLGRIEIDESLPIDSIDLRTE